MKLVSREESGLVAATRIRTGNLNEPSTLHWNGPDVVVFGSPVFDHKYCASIWRGIQSFHIHGRGWNDIAYNFGVCQHSYVYEGRGLNVWNGANGTNHGNRTSHAVMCMAGPNNPFSPSEKAAIRDCFKYISEQTAAPYKAIGHRDHKSTECPGNARYDWVRGGMKLSGGSPPPVPPKESSFLSSLSPEEQRKILNTVNGTALVTKAIYDILDGDNPSLGDTQKRQLAALKRIESAIKNGLAKQIADEIITTVGRSSSDLTPEVIEQAAENAIRNVLLKGVDDES